MREATNRSEVSDLERELRKILDDLEAVAKDLEMPLYELIPLMIHRELVIANRQLSCIHEHLDMLEARARKAEASERATEGGR